MLAREDASKPSVVRDHHRGLGAGAGEHRVEPRERYGFENEEWRKVHDAVDHDRPPSLEFALPLAREQLGDGPARHAPRAAGRPARRGRRVGLDRHHVALLRMASPESRARRGPPSRGLLGGDREGAAAGLHGPPLRAFLRHALGDRVGRILQGRRQGGRKAVPADEALAHLATEDGEDLDTLDVQGCLDSVRAGVDAKSRLLRRGHALAQIGGRQVGRVHLVDDLRVQVRHTFLHDQQLVVRVGVQHRGDAMGDDGADHYGHDYGQVVARLEEQHDRGYRHAGEAAEHGSTACHGVHARVRNDV
mmetsp:Transcript_92472/g.283105  ORF Transcript_92472/g.283105 Transcript_92472/m.283105 type:complete len:305 (-) Transcript_92472:284-1198(-)